MDVWRHSTPGYLVGPVAIIGYCHGVLRTEFTTYYIKIFTSHSAVNQWIKSSRGRARPRDPPPRVDINQDGRVERLKQAVESIGMSD